MASLLKKKSAPPDMSRIEMDGLTVEELKNADSLANTRKIQQIEASWPAGSQDACLYMKVVSKKCVEKVLKFGRKKMYGTPVTKTKYTNQVIMKLHEISVESVEDSAEGSNGLQINDKRKSFLVYCTSANEKTYWMKTLKRFIKLSREMVGIDGENDAVDSRAVWVPDSKVKVCMVCNESTFSMRNRKHHCRNCGKVVCSACSAFKAILNQGKPERVCRICHSKLGGSDPTDIPVLGAASTESAKMKMKMTGAGAGADGMSTDDYTSSSEDEDDAQSALATPAQDETTKEVAEALVEKRISVDDAIVRMAAKEWVDSQENVSNVDSQASSAVVNPTEEEVDCPDGPHAVALYDNDDPEHPDEISFVKDNILCLTRRLDAEWLEGYLFGVEPKKVGIFPAAFVEIKVAP